MRLCGNGLHDLDAPGNLALMGKAKQKRCRPCANEYQRLRKLQEGREAGAYERGAKPFCKNGHALTDENVDSERRCLTCRRIRQLKRAKERYWAHRDYYREKNRMRWRLAKGHDRSPNLAVEYAELVSHDPCSYCGGVGGEADHIIPTSTGGISVWENFTGACRSCNSSKGKSSVLHFLLRRAA